MRPVLIAVGVVGLLVGVVLAITPLTTVRTQTATPNTPVEFNVTSLVSATGTYPLSFSWAAPSSVTVVAATCDDVNPQSASMFSVCAGFVLVAEQAGIVGGFTASPKLGAIVFIWVLPGNQSGPAPTITVKIVGAEPALGTLFLLAGTAAAVIGTVLRRRPGSRGASEDDAGPSKGSNPLPFDLPPPSEPPPDW